MFLDGFSRVSTGLSRVFEGCFLSFVFFYSVFSLKKW